MSCHKAWDDIVLKLRSHLSKWKAKTLSIGGRLTLLKSTTGQVVLYDVRANQQPFTILCDFANFEAVTSLGWQRSKPVHVNENSCTPDTALMGGIVDDSVVMPDPLPSATTSITSIAWSRNSGRVGPSPESATSASTSANDSYAEETPMRNSLRNSGLSRLHAPRASNYKDDMDVFSPIQDDNRTPVTQTVSSHLSSKTDEPASVTPPEDWGGVRASDKIFHSRQQGTLPSRFATVSASLSLPSGSMMTRLQDPSLPSSQAAISFRIRENLFGSTSLSLSMKSMAKV